MSMPIFSFGDLPEELQNALRQQAAQAEMASDDFGHSIIRFMDEADDEALTTVRSMMHMLVHSTDSPLASYWEGMLTWARKERYGICPAHGVDHSKELADMSGQEVPPAGDEMDMRSGTPVNEQITPASFSPAQRGTMEQYHVDDAYDADTRAFIGFRCTGIVGGPVDGCGMIYTSLEDRMVHEPEHCSGCFAKAAHG